MEKEVQDQDNFNTSIYTQVLSNYIISLQNVSFQYYKGEKLSQDVFFKFINFRLLDFYSNTKFKL